MKDVIKRRKFVHPLEKMDEVEIAIVSFGLGYLIAVIMFKLFGLI